MSALLAIAALGLTPQGPGKDAVSDPVTLFLHAESAAQRTAAAEAVLATDIDFDTLLRRLRNGRDYSADVPRGMILDTRTGSNGLRYPFMILVPENYAPEREWPLRFELHGGMGAEEWTELDGSWTGGWNRSPDALMILPAGWWDSMWWTAGQVENFEALLARVKRTYNVDENRVFLAGASDGCVGAFFNAFRTPDRWSCFAGSVGSPDRLTRDDLKVDGQMHPANLRDQRLRLFYGGRDPLNPLEPTRRYMELLQGHGADLVYTVNAKDRHDLNLSDEQIGEFIDFMWSSRRDPLPDRISWSTERTDRYNRRSWLVIDALTEPDKGEEPDRTGILPRWGSSYQLRTKAPPPRRWGRVDLERDGNTIRATTTRVARFTLLLSPDEVDFEKPVRVVANGAVRFEGRLEPSREVLLGWATRDDDRQMLFASELEVRFD